MEIYSFFFLQTLIFESSHCDAFFQLTTFCRCQVSDTDRAAAYPDSVGRPVSGKYEQNIFNGFLNIFLICDNPRHPRYPRSIPRFNYFPSVQENARRAIFIYSESKIKMHSE